VTDTPPPAPDNPEDQHLALTSALIKIFATSRGTKIDDLCGIASPDALPRPAMIRTWHTLLTSGDRRSA
jgi:hypothetical protein